MIDSIGIYKSITPKEYDIIRSRLLNVKEEVIIGTGEVVYKATTSNKKMNVRINGENLKIIGSLSQYYKENYLSLLWNEIHLSIDKLEKELGIALRNSKVFTLDLEGTFPVTYKPKNYYEFLGHSSYYNRFIEKNTLYYNSGNRKKKFYDKGKKMKMDLKLRDFNSQNLMRFEVSYKSPYITSIEEKLGIEKLNFKNLTDASTQFFLLDLWLNEYNKINKNPKLNIDMSEIKGLGDLKNKLLVKQIDALGGVSEILETIKRSINSNKTIDSKIFDRMRRGLNALSCKPLNIISCKHLEELDTGIANTYSKYSLSI